MKRFVEGEDRKQVTLLPECLDDYVAEDNPVRVIDVFIDELDLTDLGFEGVAPADTGRPAYHPAMLLKIYVYGYLNRLQSSRRLERETNRDKNFTPHKLRARVQQLEESIARYLTDLDRADRRQTVEHPFGTLKSWMGSTHFLTKRLPRVSTEMSLHVLAYNLKRVMQIMGIRPLMQAMRA